MAMQITDTLKQLFAAQGVTANGATIDDILKSGFSQLNDAKVYGNLIADIIAQCAETGTFPGGGGGGAAPTIATEITWNGDTTELDSATVTIEGDTYTFYKVSDSVLPYGVFDGTDFYEYATVDQDDGSHTNLKWGAFDGYVAVAGTFDVISAYFDNSVASVLGGVLVPSVGTWFKKDNGEYCKSVTATMAE